MGAEKGNFGGSVFSQRTLHLLSQNNRTKGLFFDPVLPAGLSGDTTYFWINL